MQVNELSKSRTSSHDIQSNSPSTKWQGKGQPSLFKIVSSSFVSFGFTPYGRRRKGFLYPGRIAGRRSASTGRGSYPHQLVNRGPSPSSRRLTSSASCASPGSWNRTLFGEPTPCIRWGWGILVDGFVMVELVPSASDEKLSSLTSTPESVLELSEVAAEVSFVELGSDEK